MSLAVVTGRPRTCSGLAYSGVSTRIERRRRLRGRRPAALRESSFAMPKSSSLGSPSAVTRMLPGFRSRWTTRCWWAYCTAAQISRKRRSRSRTGERALAAILEQRLALDVLHDEVRLALPRSCRRRAGARCSDDRGRRRSGARSGSAAGPASLGQARPHELDRDALLELVVGAARQVDDAHAAAADLGEERVGADALARAARRLRDLGSGLDGVGRVQHAAVALGRRGERLDPRAERRVAGAGGRDVAVARARPAARARRRGSP